VTLLWSVFTRHNIRTITTKNHKKRKKENNILLFGPPTTWSRFFLSYGAGRDMLLCLHILPLRDSWGTPPFFLKNIRSYDLIIIVNQHLKKLGFLLSTYTYLTKPIFCLFLPTPSFNLEKLYPSHLVCDQRGGRDL
jgi:hypothetical protein